MCLFACLLPCLFYFQGFVLTLKGRAAKQERLTSMNNVEVDVGEVCLLH